MKTETALEVIRCILIDIFSWIDDTYCINPTHRLQEDLGLDSLAMVNLQVAIEDKFDMHFDPIAMDLLEVFETVGSLVVFLENHIEDVKCERIDKSYEHMD